MSLVGQLDTELEVKVAAALFHDVFSCRPHHVSNMTPDHVQGCDLHEGEWGKPGAVIYWNYMHDGVPEVAKEIIEEIDNEKKLVTFKVIEGHLLERYKNFYATVQATLKDKDSCLVHWIIKYEKLSEDVPEPKGLLQLIINVTKDIEAHHLPKQE